MLDLCLLEDGGERGSALASDPVARNTASEGQDGNCERAGVSMGAGTSTPEAFDPRLREDFHELEQA